jgi:hypothetical protein
MATFLETEDIKVYTSGNYPFLIIEPLGNMQFADYQAHLSSPVILAIIDHTQAKQVYLELNGLWVIGMDQQEWTVGAFQTSLKAHGVAKMAIGLAEHVYPTFVNLAEMYERQAVIPTKYFPDLDQMVAYLS